MPPTNPLLYNHINSRTSIPANEFASFESLLDTNLFKSDQLLQSPGNNCRNIFYILKGYVVAYTIDNNGNEKVLNIFTKNNWAGDFDSFWFYKESKLYLTTVGATELLQLNRPNFTIAIENKNILKYMFLVLMNRNEELENKLLQATRTSASLRYLDIHKNHPEILQHIPLHYIASFIGITPQSLSRLRKSLQSNLNPGSQMAY